MKVLIIRPQRGADVSAGHFRAGGYQVEICPMFEISPVAWRARAAQEYDALLLTSANAVRNAGTGLADYKLLPVHAVGEQTAAAAQQAGLHVASKGNAGVAISIEHAGIAGHHRLLWLSGEDRTETDVPAHMRVDAIACYVARPARLSLSAAQRIADCDAALLHSVRAAQVFASVVDAFGLSRSALHIAALSPAIAAAAGDGWSAVAVAKRPTDDDLLSALAGLGIN